VYVFGSFVKDQMAVAAWFYFWVFCSVPLVFVSVYVSVPCCFSKQHNLKSGIVILPALLFLLGITFAVQGLLCFHMNFMIDFYSSVNNDRGILLGMALNLYIAFSNTAIFTILILLILEHGNSFQFSSVFFSVL
jgi:hypothetical protein